MDTMNSFGPELVRTHHEDRQREAAQARQGRRHDRPARAGSGRIALSLVAFLALILTFGVGSAAAQAQDLGNDGIDRDCDDFPERNAVEGYFAQDGGSAERNVDGLDPDGNGIPCDEPDYDGEEPAEDTDDEPVEEDDEGDAVTDLPTTGAGTADQGRADTALILAASGLFAVATAAGAFVRFQDRRV